MDRTPTAMIRPEYYRDRDFFVSDTDRKLIDELINELEELIAEDVVRE